MKEIKTGDRFIGGDHPCYIIAEMSANHAGSLDKAIEIIHVANESGADCIKIQTYTPDTMTINSEKKYFRIKDGTWEGENLYRLYKIASFELTDILLIRYVALKGKPIIMSTGMATLGEIE
jgi:pseudaminic acid synthase